MTDALEDHEGTVSIWGRTITNLRFADDMDGSAGKEEELEEDVLFSLPQFLDRLGRRGVGSGLREAFVSNSGMGLWALTFSIQHFIC